MLLMMHTEYKRYISWSLSSSCQDFSASQDFQHLERFEGESVAIVYTAQQRNSRPSLLYIQSFVHSQVLNISENIDKKPEIDRRLELSRHLDSDTVIVTLSNLKYTDTGLYVCEFISENQHEKPLASMNILLLVKAAGWLCVDMDALTRLKIL